MDNKKKICRELNVNLCKSNVWNSDSLLNTYRLRCLMYIVCIDRYFYSFALNVIGYRIYTCTDFCMCHIEFGLDLAYEKNYVTYNHIYIFFVFLYVFD